MYRFEIQIIKNYSKEKEENLSSVSLFDIENKILYMFSYVIVEIYFKIKKSIHSVLNWVNRIQKGIKLKK